MTQHPGEDFFEALEQQLVAATERGVSRRRRRWPWLIMRLGLPWRAPTVGISAGVAATLAASAIAATLTLPTSHHRAADVASVRTHSGAFTTAGAVPRDFQPQSFTAISEFTWWLLGRARCGRHQCSAIVRTQDGGPHFTRIPAPPTSLVGQIRFATSSIGYAYGPQLWSTHDGGRTWVEAHMGATNLATAGGYVYALASIGGPTSMLARSPIGHNRWTFLRGPGQAGLDGHPSPSGLWAQGHTVIVQVGRHAWISNDHGDHFTRAPAAVPGDCQFDATVDAAVIWGLCVTGMAPDDVILSTDSGASFNSTAAVPDGPLQAFAASSASSSVAAAQGPLMRTVNGGATWMQADAPSAAWTYLGFTDSTHGVAIGNVGTGGRQDWRLYYTIDAGASYHYVPIGP